MPELRKDYILNRWVIIASERAQRPDQFKQELPTIKKQDNCPFCPGNEHLTPNEISRREKNGKWYLRVIPNKFAAVTSEGNGIIQTHNQFYTFGNAFGKHEIIVETADKTKQLWDLSAEQVTELFEVYNERITSLWKEKGINYAQVFKNHDKAAGTSIMHSHSQIIAYDLVPQAVQDEVAASKKFPSCPYCDIILKEKNSARRCFENKNCIAFTPYASRFPFEIWIFPKKHSTTLDTTENMKDLAELLLQALKKLKTIHAPYNYMLHYSPFQENLHCHIEVLPRLTTWAGFEYSGTIINPVSPEDAAKFYRGEK
ncbi:galactose-1-phosphate uridylyltransferase [Candidatus Woesearchaeota archaeon]|nr:galactose-1-phosphate uridylyltransferase [Candidatus Woesearchaeota archaeon]